MKKSVFLFLALMLPVIIFVFLRMFGRNEFAVETLFEQEQPSMAAACGVSVTLPYVVPDSVRTGLLATDSLAVLYFGILTGDAANQVSRIGEETSADPVAIRKVPATTLNEYRRKCVFFLEAQHALVLVDAEGRIRGQYTTERKEIDRLLTEITIILKKY